MFLIKYKIFAFKQWTITKTKFLWEKRRIKNKPMICLKLHHNSSGLFQWLILSVSYRTLAFHFKVL